MNQDLPFHTHNPSSTNMKEGDHRSPGTAAGLRIIDVCSLQARRDRTDAESGTRIIHSEPQISPPADHVDTDLSDYIMKVKVESQLFDGISSEDCREDIQIKSEEMDGVTIKGEKDLGKAECIQSIVLSTSIEALSRVSMKEEANDVENEANYAAERTVEYVRQFPCARCTQSFHTEIDLQMHMERHPQSPSYSRHKCSYCHYSSDSSGNLRTHLRIHTGERPYECSICGKTFAQLGHVKAHNLNHTGQRPYKCSLCDKSFVSASHRKRHMMSHTGERPYKCSVCPKAFVQFNTLNTHMRIHTGERPYKCTVCDKAFTQESGIRIHFKSHTGDRPHKCSVCGKAFVEARYLKTHMTVHTQDRPYKCSVCGKSFSQNAHVNEHMSVHTGHRPHNCSVCGKTFRTLSNARKHMRVHTEDRPYKCTVCAKTFSRMSHVCKHMKTHSDEFALAQAPSVP